MNAIKTYNKTLLASAIATVFITGCGDSSSDGTPNTGISEQKDAVVQVEQLLLDSAECSYGGIKVLAGYDENENGTLEQDEYISNKTICNDGTGETSDEGSDIFNQALVTTVLIAKDDNRCSAGGQQVLVGIDHNNNGLLDNSEILENEVLCSVGADFAPSPIINAITVNPAVVAAGSSATLTATVSNMSDSDELIWKDSQGNVLLPQDVNTPNVLSITASAASGTEIYTLEIATINEQGQNIVQHKDVQITIADAPAPTQAVSLNTKQVFLPEGYNTSQLTGDVYGSIIYAKPQPTSVVAMSGLPTPEDTQLAGFVAERTTLDKGLSTEAVLQSMMSAFASQLSGWSPLVQTSQTVLANGDINASYKITLSTEQTLTALLETLIQQTAIDKVGGSASALVPAATEIAATEYQLDITLNYVPESGSAVLTSTLVAKDKATLYSELIVSTTSESITSSKEAKLLLHNDSFTAVNQTVSKADFLFVIDNSGSMSDKQQAISDLTKAFTGTIQNAGVDFMVGTITTDSDALRGQGFTNNIDQIETDFKPGSRGSATERGIYYAEQALSPSGTVEQAGYPRPGASLSVVIMSDEPNHYPWGEVFDIDNNLFVDNGYRVYSIVNPNDASNSQYDDLATRTLGKTLNINVTDEYGAFVETMAKNAGASSAGYELTQAETKQILSSSIAVKVAGVSIDRNSTDGWQYYPLSKSIVFTGSAIPNEGENITIAYQYVENQQSN
ncbi:vWA domain-containing protein [Vibrio sp. 10N]|uniref:vWA domain-containing protein n=1 Tax=Vibrio sp. 10N TaxID=3058938 RepID=UPI002813F4D2|nr:hypothetical protein VB10N_28360 [Vibrio sp. 10N]